MASALSLLVEISQLYHGSWIDAIHQTTLGDLALGYGFLWSDLICYGVGIALGAFLDVSLARLHRLWTNWLTWPS
jgi:hypothetical protein